MVIGLLPSYSSRPGARLKRFSFVLLALSVLMLASALQFSEHLLASPVAGAAALSDTGDLPRAADRAIDLYLEITRSSMSFAVAAIGGLGSFIQEDLKGERKPAVAQLVLATGTFLVLLVSLFFGIVATQFIADTLARQMAFATPATVGFELDDRFRLLLRIQYFSFVTECPAP